MYNKAIGRAMPARSRQPTEEQKGLWRLPEGAGTCRAASLSGSVALWSHHPPLSRGEASSVSRSWTGDSETLIAEVMIQRDSASIRDKSHTHVRSSMLTDIHHTCTSAPAHRLMSHNVHLHTSNTTYIHMCTCTQTYSPGTCAPSYRHTSHTCAPAQGHTSHTYHTCTYTCMCTQVYLTHAHVHLHTYKEACVPVPVHATWYPHISSCVHSFHASLSL